VRRIIAISLRLHSLAGVAKEAHHRPPNLGRLAS
jgi:hypothetical protein